MFLRFFFKIPFLSPENLFYINHINIISLPISCDKLHAAVYIQPTCTLRNRGRNRQSRLTAASQF